MAAEHVVAAGAHSLDRHAQAAPDAIGSRHAYDQCTHQVHVRIIDGKVLLAALQMGARHTQRCDQHGDAPQQENSAGQCEKSTEEHHTVLVEDKDDQPDGKQQGSGDLAHVERPRDVGHVVQKDIRQRGIALHIRHAFVHNHHDERRYPGDHEGVGCRSKETQLLGVQINCVYISIFKANVQIQYIHIKKYKKQKI